MQTKKSYNTVNPENQNQKNLVFNFKNNIKQVKDQNFGKRNRKYSQQGNGYRASSSWQERFRVKLTIKNKIK